MINVVGFSHACKGNYGSNRNCSGNLVIGPGMHDMFGSGTSGGPCAYESNNGHGSTFAKKFFQYNTCVNPTAGTVQAYFFQSCNTKDADTPELNGTVWATRGNRFWNLPGAAVEVPCKGGSIPLKKWQTMYGQDVGALAEDMPAVSDVMTAARLVLQVQSPNTPEESRDRSKMFP